MTSLEAIFTEATTPGPKRIIPGAVLIAADKTGQIIYSKAFGSTSVDPEKASPINLDNSFWIASCTKLLTTVAAMQCVERGLLSLDDDVSTYLPELKAPEILTGFDDATGEPVLTKATKKMTLKHLLTHSSGMGYDFLDPSLLKWRAWRGETSQSQVADVNNLCLMPLLFEPGCGWNYSVSLDWAGQMVERVNGGLRLGSYMQTHIFAPLGMDSTTFEINKHESALARRCGMTTKESSAGETTTLVSMASDGLDPDPKHDLGGGGLYSTPRDYVKVLISLLRNDGALLRPETVESMFRSALNTDEYIQQAVSHPQFGPMFRSGIDSGDDDDDGTAADTAWTFGLGGIVNLEDVKGLCRKGTMTWSGLPNLYWWIDPSTGTCGLYASQMRPVCDPESMQLALKFRRHVFDMVAK